jgi:hypothetical protein
LYTEKSPIDLPRGGALLGRGGGTGRTTPPHFAGVMPRGTEINKKLPELCS